MPPAPAALAACPALWEEGTTAPRQAMSGPAPRSPCLAAARLGFGGEWQPVGRGSHLSLGPDSCAGLRLCMEPQRDGLGPRREWGRSHKALPPRQSGWRCVGRRIHALLPAVQRLLWGARQLEGKGRGGEGSPAPVSPAPGGRACCPQAECSVGWDVVTRPPLRAVPLRGKASPCPEECAKQTDGEH